MKLNSIIQNYFDKLGVEDPDSWFYERAKEAFGDMEGSMDSFLEGYKEGFIEGFMEGYYKEFTISALKMYNKGYARETVIDVLELSDEQIAAFDKELKKINK